MFQKSVNIDHFDGDTLNVIHHQDADVNAFRFLNGVVTNLQTSTNTYISNLSKTIIPALSSGFYIIYSARGVKIYKKGNLSRTVFIRSSSPDEHPELKITRYSTDGEALGELTAYHIYAGMYSVVIPTKNTEILKVGDLYVSCDNSSECTVYNISSVFPRSTLKEGKIKTDIISNNLSAKVGNNRATYSLKQTTFRSN